MELDVPTDLINKCEIGFREAVGLSSFDKNLPSSICTTFEEAASSISKHPWRCEYCSGRLLRGLESLICVYCGEYQTNDPEPISFNSTHGYSWLLQALNFNGLEAVGSLAEGRGIIGGPSPGEDEFTISDLLDLKISWQAASEKPKNNINIKTSEHNSSPNLVTPNVDFFIESKRDVVADVFEEKPYADQNKTLEDQESFTFDWNAEFQFADTKMENENLGVPVFDFFAESNRDLVSDAPEAQPVSSTADQNKTYEDQEIFTSDWNAEFQSADTKMAKESLGSVGPYVGADPDLSAHMDFVFGQKTDQRPVDNLVPFQDEAQMDFVFGQKTDQRTFDDPVPFQDEAHMDFVFGQKTDQRPVNNLVPFQDEAQMDFVFGQKTDQRPVDDPIPFQDEAHMDIVFGQKTGKRPVDNLVPFQDEAQMDFVLGQKTDKRPFDDSVPFQDEAQMDFVFGQKTDQRPVDDPIPFQDEAHMDFVFGQKTGKRTVDNLVPFQDEALMDFVFGQKTDKRPFDDSVPFQDEAHMDFVFGQKTDKRPVDDSDPFQDDLFADMDSVFQAKDGLSDDLNNINLINTDVDWFGDGNWQASSVNNMDTVKDDNLFQDDGGVDGWNDFTSSTGNQDSWKENSNEKVGDCENIAELNLFPSADDSQEVDFGKLLMSDIFSGDNNPSDTHAAYDIFSEISTTSRNAERPKNDEITPNATTPENDVQTLMSQMHDLSFMLKNELSIPSKPDDLDPFLI